MFWFWLVVIIVCELVTAFFGMVAGAVISTVCETTQEIYCYKGNQLSAQFKDLLRKKRKEVRFAWLFSAISVISATTAIVLFALFSH